MADSNLSLFDAIQSLRSELIAVQDAGGNNRLPLRVQKAEIELVLEATEADTGSGSIEAGVPKVFRVSLGGSATSSNKAIHKIRLELTIPGDPNLSGSDDFEIS